MRNLHVGYTLCWSVDSESKSYIYKRWDTIYSRVKHLLSADEVPVPSIRKHYHEQNRHGPCPCGDHNFNGGGRCHARANIIAHSDKFLGGRCLVLGEANLSGVGNSWRSGFSG